MDREAFFSAESERLRQEYEAGGATAFHEVVLLAIWNNLPIPGWATSKLEGIVRMHSEGRFERRQGIVPPVVAHNRHSRDEGMGLAVQRLLSLSASEWRIWAGNVPQTQANAFRAVASDWTDAMRGKPGQKVFTPAMVKAAFYRWRQVGSKKA